MINIPRQGTGRETQPRGWRKYSLFRGDTTRACSCALHRREVWRVDAPLLPRRLRPLCFHPSPFICPFSFLFFPFSRSFFLSVSLFRVHFAISSLLRFLYTCMCECMSASLVSTCFTQYFRAHAPVDRTLARTAGIIRGGHDRIIRSAFCSDVNNRGISVDKAACATEWDRAWYELKSAW